MLYQLSYAPTAATGLIRPAALPVILGPSKGARPADA